MLRQVHRTKSQAKESYSMEQREEHQMTIEWQSLYCLSNDIVLFLW